LLDVDPRHGAGNATHRHRRIDHRDTGITVHHHEEVAVEIEQGPRADARLEEHPDPRLAAPFATLGLVGGKGLRVQPGAGGNARQGLAGGLVGNAELHIGELPFAQYAVRSQRLDVERHRHAVTFERLAAPGIGQLNVAEQGRR
jgi:hypothetical protein